MLRRWIAIAACAATAGALGCNVGTICGVNTSSCLTGYNLPLYYLATYPEALITPSSFASWNSPEKLSSPWPNASTSAVYNQMSWLWILLQCGVEATNIVADLADSEYVAGEDQNGNPDVFGQFFAGAPTSLGATNFNILSSYRVGGADNQTQVLVSGGVGSNLFYTDEVDGTDPISGAPTNQIGGLTPLGQNQSVVIAWNVPSNQAQGSNGTWYGIPAHEMGHQLGLPDISNAGNLMNSPSISAGYLLTGAIDSATTNEPNPNTTQCGAIRTNGQTLQMFN